MSCSLPQEILDLIINYLRDEPNTLKTCCIVSKAWVQRTQKHFFAQINFLPLSSSLSLWREVFPDPTNSPARHVRTLSIRHPELITVADTDTLRTFCGVVHLKVHAGMLCNQAVSRSIAWIFPRYQIAPPHLHHPPEFRGLQPHLLPSPSRGSDVGFSRSPA
ncbi:hypothetical protein BDM02DRAFT_2029105 [Thelephora ganbajun]|uniref:Uncharacterized protein n=1 Tax=Thelephora ganbajun TaxID=370292 RepID=A0ACB6YZ75_THEGA|nr:hypothetical protein BDM02DRAFT_2029105 [Thelephora ganbajun]